MERAIEVLQHAQTGMWVVLGLAALRRWQRRRLLPEALMLAMFGTLATLSVVAIFLPDRAGSPAYDVTIRVIVVVIVFLPYLLFRFAATFRMPPRPVNLAAAAVTGAVATLGALIELPPEGAPRTAPVQVFVFALIVQWVALSTYTAVSLWRGGRGQPRVARYRMRTLALGAIGLSIVLVVAGTANPTEPAGGLELASSILTLISGPLFLLGFAPPQPVVWWWRRHDEEALRTAHRDLVRSATPSDIGRVLLPHAIRIAGGSAGLLRDAAGAPIASFTLDAANGRSPEPIVIPMNSGSLEIVASPYAPYFGAESVASLAELASLTDLALARADVLIEQQRLASELRIANQAMAEFVAIASHDLRTPLTVVQGLAHTLTKNWERFDDTSRRDQLGAIVRQSSHLSRIVEDLLTVSRLGSGGIEPAPGSVSLAPALRTIVADLAGPDAVTIAAPDGARAWVDPAHLARIVSNLIRNAMNYGAPPVTIEVVAHERTTELRVRDGGPGVPADFRDRLFEKFWRADKSKSRSASGTGLGLAIVRGLARAAGGDAWYEHGERGHAFAVSLPSSREAADERGSMDKARVLVVVEDEPDVRLLVRATLSTDPHIEIAGEAATAREAIELARTQQPGLIILDHSLDEAMTGLEAAPLLKEAAPNAKILLFSAFDLAAEARAVEAIDRYLPKSQFHDLLPTVQAMLGLQA